MLGAAAAAAAARAGTRQTTSAFCGIVGGVGRLAEHLRDVLVERGVRVDAGVMVRELTRTPTGWRLTCGPVPTAYPIEADAVVLAVPAPAAARLLSGPVPVAARLLGEVEVASVALVTLALDRRELDRQGYALPGSGFLVPATETRTIKASTFSSGKWAWVDALSDDVVFVRASFGRAGETAVLQRPDEDLVAIAVREVGEAVGFPLPHVVDHHVQRWGGGLPQYAVGHLDRMGRVADAVAGVPGLEVCGAAYGGVGIPAVIASARAAADRLMSSKGQ
jgi:oxygen-dependent protoporphyrinogen oxidase